MINLKKLTTIGAVASCAVLLSACSLYGNNAQPVDDQTGSNSQTAQGEFPKGTITISFSDSGVTPLATTVKSGENVIWLNESSKTIQVASNSHPTHTENRELTNGESVISVESGASATVTLTKTGTWGFHDHLNPKMEGSVVVQ